MKTPFDHIKTTINGHSLADAYEMGTKHANANFLAWLKKHASKMQVELYENELKKVEEKSK